MIGELPTCLTVGGKAFAIRSDFRVALNIIQAMNDPELSPQEKCYVCLRCLYVSFESLPGENLQEAAEKAYWFIGGGDMPRSETDVRIFDWEQDEGMIFPAVNKAAGYETRAVKYLHWWSFLGLFGEIGEGLFSQVSHIRRKIAKGEKLDKWEKRFVRENKALVTLKTKLSDEERRAEDEDETFINALIGRQDRK